MGIIVENSVCVDCNWQDSCQKVNKLREMCNNDAKTPEGRPKDIFNIVITKCSLKNYIRDYCGRKRGKIDDGNDGFDENEKYYEGGMYYCKECHSMHHGNSRIGKAHKKYNE